MIIKIKSQNQHLLDLLFKNPNTDNGLYFKSLKNGNVVGHVISPNQYEVVFQDTKYSYLPEESNQIDFQSYCSPLVVLHISSELFSHLLKKKEVFESTELSWLQKTQGEVDNQECTIEIPTFYVHSNWYRNGQFLLSKYFPNVKLEHRVGRNFSLEIKALNVFNAFNLLNLVAVFTHITNEYGIFTYITDDFATKYSRILTNINQVPYFVFYLFIKRAVKSDRQFAEVKTVFEEYLLNQGIKADLTYNHTHLDRIEFICKRLENNIPVLDIGCGEFQYYRKLMKMGFEQVYFAVDTDEKYEAMSENIMEKLGFDNLQFYKNIDDIEYLPVVNILLTEVIEHNSLSDAKILIEKTLTLPFNTIYITTPNSEFNQYYFEEEEKMRHDDHHFELDSTQFRQLIDAAIADKKEIEVEYHGIGDCLNGIQPTQAVIIKRKNIEDGKE